MIERFNFYDVYGYFVPGLTLIVLLWLPLGISAPTLPEADLWSALAVVVLAYVVGHMIQLLVRYSWPSKTRKHDEARYWHDVLLDDDDLTFSNAAKEKLFARMMEKFALDARGKGRDEAFQLCRASLVAKKIASYAEQFQGMYAMMRGLAAAFVVGAAFHLGFAVRTLATQLHPYAAKGALVLGGLCTACILAAMLFVLWHFIQSSRLVRDLADEGADKKEERKRAERVRDGQGHALCLCYAALAFAAGIVLFGNARGSQLSAVAVPAIIGISLVPLVYLCKQSHDFFARESAKAVYQYFLVLKDAGDDRDERHPEDSKGKGI